MHSVEPRSSKRAGTGEVYQAPSLKDSLRKYDGDSETIEVSYYDVCKRLAAAAAGAVACRFIGPVDYL